MAFFLFCFITLLFAVMAISSPSRESEEAAWNALYPAVLKLRDYYEFAVRLEQEAFPRVLHFLCVGDVAKNLESFQATATQLGDLLHFVSLFDELKMVNPNIQNDFSYYRRSLSRMKMASPCCSGDVGFGFVEQVRRKWGVC
ncbi:hypothetical protein BJ742DRAFT_733606 [Cladochytrium replicatum]|nr:hypothetical protein BJ742DRAFT_733606 [Cladochytrium replicatum]